MHPSANVYMCVMCVYIYIYIHTYTNTEKQELQVGGIITSENPSAITRILKKKKSTFILIHCRKTS